MAIPEKYKGKSFANIANKLQSMYKDRHDPISLRGLNKDMGDLKEAQEYKRKVQEIQEQTEQMLNNPEGMQEQPQGQVPQMQPPQMQGQGADVDIPQEQQGTFQREASSDYNEKFFNGGTMNGKDDPTQLDYSGLVGTEDVQKLSYRGMGLQDPGVQIPNRNIQGVQGNTEDQMSTNLFDGNTMGNIGLAMQAAPLIGNIAGLASLERADPVKARTINTSGLTSALNNFKPRENKFSKVDLDLVERGITEASGRFTQNNINASRGNAGAFVANELGNQNNLYRSIGEARLKAQGQDQQTEQLNAADRARVDAMNLQKAQATASIKGRGDMFNAQMQFQADDMNARNDAAYESTKAQLWSDLGSNIGNIGESLVNTQKAGNLTGYGFWGGYKDGDTNEKAMGGDMSTDPNKPLVFKQDSELSGTMLDYIDEQLEYPDEEMIYNKANKYKDLQNIRERYASTLKEMGNKTDPSLKYIDKVIKREEKTLSEMEKKKKQYMKDNSLKTIVNTKGYGGLMKALKKSKK